MRTGRDGNEHSERDEQVVRALFRRRSRRTIHVGAVLSAAVSVAVLTSACSVLGLNNETPPDVSIVTSAAPVAGSGGTTGVAVTVPTLQTGATSTRPSPTPWDALTSSAPPSSSAAPLTAPTTTRTLSFTTFSSVTNPTVVAPTQMATPPPDCYTKGTCKALGSSSAGSGTVLVVNPPGGDTSVVILTIGGKAADSVPVLRLGSPTMSCTAVYCLVQGSTSGMWFGAVVAVTGGHLKAMTGSAASASSMRLVGSGGSVLVAGTQQFTGYGLPVTDAPVAARTWAVSGGVLTSTGCGAPRLYATPPAATSAQRGSCSGTPQIAGYGSASANKITYLGGFVTPSGNIACAVVPGNKLACTAKQHSFSVPTCGMPVKDVPASLRGLRVELGRTGGMSRDGCLGYTLIGSPATAISYGRLAAGGGFVCEVQDAGVTCTGPSGHGFTLSRTALTAK